MNFFEDIIDQRVGFEYGGKVKKVRKFISDNPKATKDQIIKYLKKIGYRSPGAKYEELKKRGIFEGKAKKTDAYVISDELKEKIKKNVKLKPGQKFKFYDPETGTGHTFGVKKGTPNYDRARYYGGKQEKDITRKKEEYKKLTPRQRRRVLRRRERLRKKRLQDPVKKAAEQKRIAKYMSRPEVKAMYKKSRAKYEATPRRKKMKKEYMTKRQTERGLWPQGNNYKENVWRDLKRSTEVKNPRWVIADEKGTPLTPDQYPKKNGKTFWGSGNYKRTKFLDTETGQLIKLDSNAKGKGIPMRKYLNTNFGKNTYQNAIKSYEIKDTLKNYKIKIDGKEQNLGTVLRDRIYTPEEIAARTEFGTGVFHVSHDEGVGKNWWKSRVTTGDANYKLSNLDSTLKRDLLAADTEAERTKVLKKYEKQVKKQPGGIISKIEGKTYGVVPTEKSVVDALGKKARIRGTEGFKQLIAKLSDNPTCAVKFKKGGLTPSLDDCFEGGMRALKNKNINKPHQIQGAKQLMNAGKRVGANKFVNILTNLGIVGEVAFIAGDIGIRQAMGRPFYEAFLAATFREGRADLLRRERAGGASKELQEAERLDREIANLNSQIENIDALGDFYSQADKDALVKRRDKLLKEYEPYRQYMTSGSMKNISDRVRTANVIDSDLAKSLTSKLQLRDNQLGIPNIADYDEVDAGVSKVRPKERSVLPSSQQAMIDNTRRQLKSLQIDESQMSDKVIGDFINDQFTTQERMQAELDEGNREEQVLGFNPDKSLEIPSLLPKGTYIPRPGEEEELLEYMSRVQGAKDGGLMNLTRTTPPKRSLNKDSQGLASLPEYDR